MERRVFLRDNIVIAGGLLLPGISKTTEAVEEVDFRFITASDGHYGMGGNTDGIFKNFVDAVNKFHKRFPVEFIVLNGDVVHRGQQEMFEGAKKILSGLDPKMYITQGNHDNCTAQFWEKWWGIPVNYSFTMGRRAILLATTSDEFGSSLCPNLPWFYEQLEKYRDFQEIYIFIHITPHNWTYFGKSCPAFHELLSNYSNITAVFNGHDHDHDDIKIMGNVPYMFSGRFGSNWGTPYFGFRVVEMLKSGKLRTYMMDPVNRREPVYIQVTVADHPSSGSQTY